MSNVMYCRMSNVMYDSFYSRHEVMYDDNDRITRVLLAEIYCKMSHSTHERVTSHTHESHVTDESRHARVTSHMSRVTHGSCHTASKQMP